MTTAHDDPAGHARFGELLALSEVGLAGEAEERWMRDHLARCETCRTLAEREPDAEGEATSDGARHLPAAMIATWDRARTALRGLERTLVARHLEGCARCRREIAFLGHEPSLDAAPAAGTGTGAVGTGTHAWVARLAQVVERLRDLVVVEPLPVHMMRAAPADEAGADRLRGLEAYAGGDYAGAESHLARAAAASDDAEAWLYLGSSRLVRGHARAAMTDLEAAIDRAGEGPVADEARWQLANAALLVGDAAASVRHLEALAGGDRRRAAAARALLDALERRAERKD